MSASLRERIRDPVLWVDLLQLVKTVIAAVVAWLLARKVFGLQQPFLAPWAALLTVHATVYRTLARGAQQVGAVVAGVVIAFAAGSAFGVNAASIAAALLAALLVGSIRALRSESTTAAATALVVLVTGYSGDQSLLLARLLDTGIGIGVGVLVTLVVWAPLRDRSAARQVDRIDDLIGDLLCQMAAQLGRDFHAEDAATWEERTRELDDDIDRAWGVVREARESGRLNPRPRASERARASEDFGAVLERLEQATSEIRSMARSLGKTADTAEVWDPRFRDPWHQLLGRTGRAVADAKAADVAQVRAALEDLSDDLSDDDLPGPFWPVYGALIVNLRNIVDVMDVVAEAQPVVPATRAPQSGALSRLFQR
jgi:uncharacterized membrane protein YccC